jgi:hypothetical protein
MTAAGFRVLPIVILDFDHLLIRLRFSWNVVFVLWLYVFHMTGAGKTGPPVGDATEPVPTNSAADRIGSTRWLRISHQKAERGKYFCIAFPKVEKFRHFMLLVFDFCVFHMTAAGIGSGTLEGCANLLFNILTIYKSWNLEWIRHSSRFYIWIWFFGYLIYRFHWSGAGF